MDERKIDFGALEWRTPLPGARCKAAQQDNRLLRLVEFTKGFVEPGWCTKGHIGYVLEGEMDVDFGGEVVRYSTGDGLMIPEGKEKRHKVTVVTDVVRLILVENAEQRPALDRQ